MVEQNIQAQFKQAWGLIEQSQSIFLTTHEGTDGDDLGSLLAVRLALLNLGKDIFSAVKGGVPESLDFLPGSETVEEEMPGLNFDLIITFGCNRISRTGFDPIKFTNKKILNFDHHPDNTQFGAVNVVDARISSVAELVYGFLNFGRMLINKDMATCLLTGIFTDTGGFKHANTSADTLESAADLLKRGARIDKIAYQTMGKKRPSTIKAWAQGLEHTRFDPDKQMVFSVLTKEDLEQIGASDEDLDGFVELLNSIPQARFALLLRQDGDMVKGSLRSEPQKQVDVSEIARNFGGGGHKLASGFKIKGRLVKQGDAWRIE
ncbi:MAG: bifunctional oligoribonuclease/PAP phosphatase NrnA [Candidatus Doudnabacteria bacterium]|nr:bifunctional oligoribonuclease/PAP phosphatase NrnA [Candidatus Doudnabacteria bacterium]